MFVSGTKYILCWYYAWYPLGSKYRIMEQYSHLVPPTWMYTGRQPSYRGNWNCTAVKSGPTSFRSILTNYFLYKYIVCSNIFISLLSSMFSSTFLCAWTISVVPVWWLSSSVHKAQDTYLHAYWWQWNITNSWLSYFIARLNCMTQLK